MDGFKYVGALSADYVIRSLTNARTGKDEQWMLVRGYASDTSWDKLKGKVYPKAIYGMVNCVNAGSPTPIFRNDRAAQNAVQRDPVIMDVDHSPNWTDQIGRAVYAKVVEEVPAEMVARGMNPEPPLFYVEFEIDLEMSHGRDFKRALDKGDQLGLSIYGQVVDGYREWVNRAKGDYKDHFHQIDLTKIAITSQPVNNSTLTEVVQRSLTGVPMKELEMSQEAATPTDSVEEPAAPETEEVVTEAAPEVPEVQEGTKDSVEVPAGETESIDSVDTEVTKGSDEPAPAVEVPAPDAPVVDEAVTTLERSMLEAVEALGLEAGAVEDLIRKGVLRFTPPASPVKVEAAVEPAVEVAEVAETALADASATETEEPVEMVARSELASLVNTDVFRAFEEQTREVIGGLTDALEQAEARINDLVEDVKTLSGEVVKMSNTPAGRRGATLMRSFAAEEEASAAREVPLGHELDPATRDRIMLELVRTGQAHVATQMMMGWLRHPDAPNYAKQDPLLPGQGAADPTEGAMTIDGQPQA